MVKTARDDSKSKEPPFPAAIEYRLSDPAFLRLKWTMKPNTTLMIPVVLTKGKFANPVISPWFQPRGKTVVVRYRNGKPAYVSKNDGTGKIYYPSGELAVKIVKGGNNKQRTRIWVYNTSEVDTDGVTRSHQIVALFDSLGNGVVYNNYMTKRLVYNQTEGIILDSPVKIPIYWKWHDMTYSGSLSVMNIDDEESSPTVDYRGKFSVMSKRTDNLTESSNRKKSSVSSTKTNSTSLSKTVDWEVENSSNLSHYINTGKLYPLRVSALKPIAFRINKYFSLRIFSQSEIYLTFFAENLHTQLKIGVLYNPHDKLVVAEIDETSALVEKVLCVFEVFPPRTESMVKFKQFVQEKRINARALIANTTNQSFEN